MVFTPADRNALVSGLNSWFSDSAAFEGASDGSNGTNGPISDWDVSNVTDFSSLFNNKATFNSNIGSWDTSNVTNMSNMFRGTRAFNQDIGSWNTAKVENMSLMFRDAIAFNNNNASLATNGNSWNTSKVTNMNNMFRGATAFDQNIGNWNTSKVTNMGIMFQTATAFDQNIRGWDTDNVTTMTNMFRNATAMHSTFSGVTGFGDTPSQQFFNQRPQLSTSTPNDNAINVSLNSSIVLTFDESVDVETGNITIKKTSDDSTIETIDVTSSQVTGTGTNKITISPNTLPLDTEMYVLIDSTCFDDTNSLSYPGITNTTALSFTTEKNPQLSTSTPSNNAINVSQKSSIVLNFDRNVDVETGNITIKKTSDNSTIETIDVTSSQVTGTGTNKITISPNTLPLDTEMYVLIDSTCFDDTNSLSYPGITNTTTLSFTTAKKPKKKKKRNLIKQLNELLSSDQGEFSFEQVKEKLRNGEELSMNGGLIIIKAAIPFTINNENQVVYITRESNQINKIYDDLVEAKNAGYLNSALEYYNNIFNVSPYYTNIINAIVKSI